MTSRSIRQQRKQREAERDMVDRFDDELTRALQYGDRLDDMFSDMFRPTQMKGEPINTVGPNGERL